MTVNRLTVCVITLSLFFAQACMHPGYKTFGKEILDEDVAFLQVGVTTKGEVVERLGESYTESHEDNVISYRWCKQFESFNLITLRTEYLCQWYGVYIQFDSNARVKRLKRMQLSRQETSPPREWHNRE